MLNGVIISSDDSAGQLPFWSHSMHKPSSGRELQKHPFPLPEQSSRETWSSHTVSWAMGLSVCVWIWILEYSVCLCLIPLYDEKFKLVRSGKEIGVNLALASAEAGLKLRERFASRHQHHCCLVLADGKMLFTRRQFKWRGLSGGSLSSRSSSSAHFIYEAKWLLKPTE